jgi:hypothetical protein
MTRRGPRILGKWRIVEMDLWDTAYIDMLGPGHIELDPSGGSMEFGAIQIGLDCHYGTDSVHFTFQGHDEMTEVSGDGDANIEPDGTLIGEIRFHLGDEASFTARRW